MAVDQRAGEHHLHRQHTIDEGTRLAVYEPNQRSQGMSRTRRYDCNTPVRLCSSSTSIARMSEDGWREFLGADGVDDWVVLHGGPTAVFRVGTLQEAARLAADVAEVSGLERRTLLTVASDRLTVKLTREMWGTESRHVDVARAISALARQHGASADRRAVQEVQFAVAAKPGEIDFGFWRAVLGYVELQDDNCMDPLGQGSTVWMQELDPGKFLRHAMHVDVSVARDEAVARMEMAVAAGGRMVDDTSAPGAWILADQSGNKVCIAAWPDGAPMSDS